MADSNQNESRLSKEAQANAFYEEAAAKWLSGEYGEAYSRARLGADILPPSYVLPDIPEKPLQGSGRLIADLQTFLANGGPEIYAPTEKNFSSRLELVRAYVNLGQLDKAIKNLHILLGMAAGNNLWELVSYFAVELCRLLLKMGDTESAHEAARLALLPDPLNMDAFILNLNFAIEDGKYELLFKLFAPWLRVKDINLIKKIAPYFSCFSLIPNMGASQLQERFLTLAKYTEPSSMPLREQIYQFPLGRKITWEFRAKDLFETYGHTDGGYDSLEEAIAISQPKKILEVGCGNGRNLALFSRMGIESAGQDISASCIELAEKRKLKQVSLYCGPLQDLNFANNEFDLIVSNRVLGLLKTNEVKLILKEITRIGKYLYLNELMEGEDANETYYHRKYDYTAMLTSLGWKLYKKIPGKVTKYALLFVKETY